MGLDELTDRERAVLDAARTGAPARVIAERLFISRRTVETHLGSLYRKLGVTNRVELLAYLHARPVAGQGPRALPSVLAVADGFVGRGAELAQLEAALEAVGRRERAAVMIGGEPGIGKSALVAHAASRAGAAGMTVLAGRCDRDFRAPFGPVADALRPYLAGCADIQVACGPAAGSLGVLLPELADRLPVPLAVEDAATSRRLLVESVRHVLRHAAGAGPVLLVLEDVHWADQATIALIRHLVTADDLAGVALMATFRNDELDREHPLPALLAELWREPSVTRLDLAGLPRGDTGALASQVRGGGFSAADLERLQLRTNGNPLFVLQLLRPGTAQRVPGSLREVVLDRVARLGAVANRVLRIAAALGGEVDARLLVAVVRELEVPDAERAVADALDAATAARLLEHPEGDRYCFAHDVVREALYGELNPVAAARTHAAAGRALLALHADDLAPYQLELAMHFGAAAARGEGERAAVHGLAAAQQAIERLAPDDALALAAAATAHLPPGLEHDRIRLGLALVAVDAQGIRMDLPAHRAATLDAVRIARRLDDPQALADCVDRRYIPMSMGSLDEELLAIKLEALGALGGQPSAQRVRLLAGASYQRMLGGHGWSAIPQAEQALADARTLGDPNSVITGLYAVASATRGLPDLEPQLAVAEELVALGRDRADLSPECNGWRFRAALRLAGGDRDGFERDLATMDEFGARTGSVFVRSTLALWRTLLALLDGDLPAAERHAGTVLELSAGHPNFVLGHFVELVEIRTLQGRAADICDAALTTSERVPGLGVLRAVAARVHLDAGDPETAARLVEGLLVDGVWQIAEDWLRPPTLAYLAPVARAVCGATQRAALAALLAPYAGQLVVAGPGALVVDAVDHARAILLGPARQAEATRLLRSALSLAERVRSPVLTARIRADLDAVQRR